MNLGRNMRRIKAISNLLILIFLTYSCSYSDDSGSNDNVNEADKHPELAHVTYFIENSGGMFGYVSKFNNYISSVSEIAQKPDFVSSGISQQFYFINGFDGVVLTDLGSNAGVFTSKLNEKDYNVGNIQGNDLNRMFQIALETTSRDSVSVFITDAIYDIQDKDNPMNALIVESRETRRQFISGLNLERGIQTLIVKINSHFEGTYYYGNQFGRTEISMDRPFYMFFFGHSELLNEYLHDSYLMNLDGYENHVRYFVSDDYNIEYAASSHNQEGAFTYGSGGKTTLRNVRPGKDGSLQFSVMADLSEITFPESYLMDTSNYELSSGLSIKSIEPYRSDIVTGIYSFTPTHIFTVRAANPKGALNIKLQKNSPQWIAESHTDDDQNIESLSSKTWGLSYLISGIEGAYMHTNRKDYVINMQINID